MSISISKELYHILATVHISVSLSCNLLFVLEFEHKITLFQLFHLIPEFTLGWRITGPLSWCKISRAFQIKILEILLDLEFVIHYLSCCVLRGQLTVGIFSLKSRHRRSGIFSFFYAKDVFVQLNILFLYFLLFHFLGIEMWLRVQKLAHHKHLMVFKLHSGRSVV